LGGEGALTLSSRILLGKLAKWVLYSPVYAVVLSKYDFDIARMCLEAGADYSLETDELNGFLNKETLIVILESGRIVSTLGYRNYIY
jgi:hypothetical protein